MNIKQLDEIWSKNKITVAERLTIELHEKELSEAIEYIIKEKYKRVDKKFKGKLTGSRIRERRNSLGAKLNVLRQLLEEYPQYLTKMSSNEDKERK